LKHISFRDGARMRGRRSRSRMVWVALVALVWVAPLLAGAPKEVAVRS
jgi:hypothetical protein